MRTEIVIDENGEALEGSMHALQQHLKSFGDTRWLPLFALKSMGFAAVVMDGEKCHIKFRPRLIGDFTLIRLMELIDDAGDGTLALTVYNEATDNWDTSLLARSKAMGAIAELILIEKARHDQRVLVSDQSHDEFEFSHPFSAALRLWKDIGLRDGEAFFKRTSSEYLHDRYVLCRLDDQSGEVMLSAYGPAKPKQAKDLFGSLLGRPIRQQPDIWFGRSCSEAFALAAVSGQPQIQAVDAMIDWPGRPKCRHTYRRILLPFHADGQKWILSGTIEDPTLDLRRKRA